MNTSAKYAGAVDELAGQCSDSIDACFADPISLFEAIRIAAAKTGNVSIDGQDDVTSHLLTPTGAVPACSVEALESFVADLHKHVRIRGESTDVDLGHSGPVEYTLEFAFDPGEHERSGGGRTETVSLLLRNNEPVLASVSRVHYSTSMDDSLDSVYRRDEQTYLLSDDDVSTAVFEVLRGRVPHRPR